MSRALSVLGFIALAALGAYAAACIAVVTWAVAP